MVQNEHVDAINYTVVDNYDSEDEETDMEGPYVFYRTPMPYEEWCDWHSEHLLNMWMSIREYNRNTYNQIHLNCDFSKFCEFCYQFSDKLP